MSHRKVSGPEHRVLHRLPGFDRHFELGTTFVRSFREIDCRDWYREFVDRVLASLGTRKHLPVFRLSHGEFIMAVGRQVDASAPIGTRVLHHLAKLARGAGLLPAFYSGSKDNSYEQFSKSELASAQECFRRHLRDISREGIVAAAFYENAGYQQYIPKVLDFLAQNDIELTADNYVPFYGVYALLHGPDADRLFRNRRVLVVTSFPGDKRERLTSELLARGASSVQFHSVSPVRAMFDTIDLNNISQPIDITLVGAGTGAAAVLAQVRPLGSLAIDAGFAIDAIAFPEKRWNRPYCIPDSEFDINKVNFISLQTIEMLKRLNRDRGVTSASLAELERVVRSRQGVQ